MKHSYRYVRFETNQGEAKSLFSFDWEKFTDENGELKIRFKAGVAFCSPKDTFYKKMARQIADKRLSLDKRKSFVEGVVPAKSASVNFVSNADFESVLSLVMSETRNLPNFALKAFAKEKYKLTLRNL